jgi:hypothetical protein
MAASTARKAKIAAIAQSKIKPKKPIQRNEQGNQVIDLNKDQKAKDYLLTQTPEFRQEQARLKEKPDPNAYSKVYDNGYKGLKLPDGSMFTGDEAQADIIASVFKQRKKAAADALAGEVAKQKTVADIQEELDRAKLKKQMQEEQAPKKATNEQINSIGQIDPRQPIEDQNLLELTQSIQRNVQKRKEEETPQILPKYNKDTGKMEAAPIPYLNKLTAFAGQVPVGKEIIAALGQNRAAREYLQDYSNADNYGTITGNILQAKKSLYQAISDAGRPGNPEQSQLAIEGYHNAIQRLILSESQLKMIEQGDQRDYVDHVHTDRVLLRSFLDNLVYGKGGYNEKMRDALMKSNVQELMQSDTSYNPLQEVNNG